MECLVGAGVSQELDWRADDLGAGLQHPTQDSLSVGSDPSAVPARHFAIHHCWADDLFGSETGGLDGRVSQKCEPLRAVIERIANSEMPEARASR